MIVDAHVHIWEQMDQLGQQTCRWVRDRQAQTSDFIFAGPQVHEQTRNCVDVSIVLGLQSRHVGWAVPNTVIANYVNQAPDRLIGFGGIDPTTESWSEVLDELLTLKLAGVVVSPVDQNFHPCDTRAMQLYERCCEHHLPVVMHYGEQWVKDSVMEYGRPYLLDEVAQSFPELRLIMGYCSHPWCEQALVLIGKHRHVYADLAGVTSRPFQLYNLLLQAHQMNVTDKLLLGSDFPFQNPEQVIESIYSLNRFSQTGELPSVPREKLRGIVERDTLACLNIKRGRPVDDSSSDGSAD